MYHVIINPSSRSGRGKKVWENVKEILLKHNVEYQEYFTPKDSSTVEYVCSLYNKTHAVGERLKLMVLGGDGTLNEVIQGLPSYDNVAISCIPIGTSNDLARALGISYNPDEAITHLLTKPTSLFMDVGCIHCENSEAPDDIIPDVKFLVSTGMGYDAAVCQEAFYSKIKQFLNVLGLGQLSYGAICLKQLLNVQTISGELTINADSEPIKLDKLFVVVGMNNKYEGGGFAFAPEALNHDGMLDVMTISNLSKRKILKLLPTAKNGDHINHEGINIYRTSCYTLRTSSPVWVHTDGEVRNKADFISVSCEREALRIIY